MRRTACAFSRQSRPRWVLRFRTAGPTIVRGRRISRNVHLTEARLRVVDPAGRMHSLGVEPIACPIPIVPVVKRVLEASM